MTPSFLIHVPADLFLKFLAGADPALIARLYGKLWMITIEKSGLSLFAPAGWIQSQDELDDGQAYFDLVAPILTICLEVSMEDFELVHRVAAPGLVLQVDGAED